MPPKRRHRSGGAGSADAGEARVPVKKERRDDSDADAPPAPLLLAATHPDAELRQTWETASAAVPPPPPPPRSGSASAADNDNNGDVDASGRNPVEEEEDGHSSDGTSSSSSSSTASSAARLSTCSPPRLSSARTSGAELQLLPHITTAANANAVSRCSVDDTPHSRLVIRDIDVENFKSYYGVHRIGPFHKTFTAVIGPNGSGKSNVIDAMLFVFGRNAKKIRLEKLAEVIHNSAAHPSLSYASVTVNFTRVLETAAEEKDPDQRREIAGSELRIKREVFRSGASQYSVDGVRRTQKEVMDCLVAHGVDLEHNRFLILQGEVEQIALMKPKAEKEGEEGLLEYLDDLIGTSEFVGRIADTTAAAETAQLARMEALDKERRLKAEREALDEAKTSTLSFVTKDNQLQKTLIVMCQLRMRGIEERLEAPRRLLAEVDERIVQMESAVVQRRAEKAAAEEAAVAAKRHLAEAQRARDAVRTRRHSAEAHLEQVKSGADQEEKARKKVADQMRKAKEELQRAQLHQQDAEREAAIHQQNHGEAAAAVASLQQEHDALSQELLPTLRPLRQQLEAQRGELAPYERAVTEAKEQLRSATDRLGELTSSASAKKQQMADLVASAARSETRVAELQRLLAEADTKDVRGEVLRVQDQIGESARRKYAINNAIQELKNTYRDGEADDRAMEFLLAQRSLTGYYGTLRQLGRIDDAYDVAAGVASNAWGFHVVEDRQTATAALELLKQHNIGRATMMVISEVEREVGPRMARPFTSPNAKARRLFDLIQPTHARFRSVFYQAVRDTLVVDTLAEARETAFGGAAHHPQQQQQQQQQQPRRHRVVTTKGELVEPSGAITGGGAAPRGAKLKAARSPQDKQSVKEDLQRLQQDLVEAAEEERALNVRLHQLHEQESQVSPEQLRKLRHELNAIVAKTDADAARLATLRGEVDHAAQRLQVKQAKYAQDVEDCEAALHRAEKARITHRADVEALEARVDEAGGRRLKDVAASLAAQQERLDAEEASVRACRRHAQKHRAAQERKTADITDYERQLKTLEAEAQDDAKGRVRECVEVLEGITRELNGAEAQLAKAQTAAEDARAAVPIASGAALNAQKVHDDEQRYRQTEAAKIADALQELAKFQHKIDGCEDKIRENAELYGKETLGLSVADSEGAEQSDADADDADDANDDDEEEEDGDDVSDGDPPEEEGDDEEERQRSGGERGARKRARTCGSRAAPETATSASSLSAQQQQQQQPSKRPHVELRRMTFRLSPEELDGCDYDRSVHLAKALSEETRRLHSEIDFRAVALWRERDVAHREAKAIYDAKKLLADETEAALQALKDARRHAFMQTFELIRQRLKEVYQLLTHGGDADMELVDVHDPFEGIQFVVRPPKKSWKQISNLSGGEKTLSSLALIFSLHHIKPTPIYVMDEIDAALDFRNVSVVAHYVLRQARGAQFIIISLRNNMFEEAHQLVGVCKVNDTTATLVLRPRSFVRLVGAQLAEAAEQQRRQGEQHGHRRRRRLGERGDGCDESDPACCPGTPGGPHPPRTPSSGARPTDGDASPTSTSPRKSVRFSVLDDLATAAENGGEPRVKKE
ncbi:RecF/RecN/SMC domain protein [Novymonas esmeraldas]|uniref:Structural maintenance of chromosomes protein 4 n=1 Tax=Novymonas esmeraldas TaxID=1808958 RepID=A0AAW0EP28_9TRYP